VGEQVAFMARITGEAANLGLNGLSREYRVLARACCSVLRGV
jgi:hypothetical protein